MANTKNYIRQAPCFVVADIQKSADYYRDVLGYRYDMIWGGGFCMPKRDSHTVMLKQVEDSSDVRSNTTVVASRHTHDGEEGEHLDMPLGTRMSGARTLSRCSKSSSRMALRSTTSQSSRKITATRSSL